MNYEVLEAIGQIAREKDIDRTVLVETLEAGLLSATKKRYADARDISVTVVPETGDITITAVKTVVETVTNPDCEISLEEAQASTAQCVVGNEIVVPLSFDDFGRSAVQAAKQVIFQKVREARRERIYHEFKDKVGQILSGSVQQVDRGNLIVLVSGAEAFLPWRHQIRREKYSQGESIRAVVLEVLNSARGPQIILSRGAPELVQALFTLESPEIREGIVKIEAIAREPGVRTKLAVSSREPRVDPIGACVGVRGVRVQAVVKELGGERMDIIPHTSDATMFISRALSPARVERVILSEDEAKALVVVPDDQLSLAIGKGGQNVRLASRLTGWGLDLLTESEYGDQLEVERAAQVEVAQLPGVGAKLARQLEMSGFETVHDVAKSKPKDLMRVPGIGKVRAEGLNESAVLMVRDIESAFKLKKRQEEQERHEEQEKHSSAPPEPSDESEGAVANSESASETEETVPEQPASEDGLIE
jgi:N utilization substance protein A